MVDISLYSLTMKDADWRLDSSRNLSAARLCTPLFITRWGRFRSLVLNACLFRNTAVPDSRNGYHVNCCDSNLSWPRRICLRDHFHVRTTSFHPILFRAHYGSCYRSPITPDDLQTSGRMAFRANRTPAAPSTLDQVTIHDTHKECQTPQMDQRGSFIVVKGEGEVNDKHEGLGLDNDLESCVGETQTLSHGT